MFGNMKLFLVLNRISHSFALLACAIFWSTLEINVIFLHIHVLFSILELATIERKCCPKGLGRKRKKNVHADNKNMINKETDEF